MKFFSPKAPPFGLGSLSLSRCRLVAATAVLLTFGTCVRCVFGQEQATPVASPTLSLADAEAYALANQPRMLAAQIRMRASSQRIREARSAYFPSLGFNATGVRVADTGTSLAAGFLTTSAVSDRFAYGGSLTQLVSDFGRTGALVSSARAVAQAQADESTLTRAQVRLNVRDSFYQVLGAEAVLHAAQAAQTNRHLIAQQLTALSQSELRSTVDVNFAEVLASEADLAVVRAQSVVAQLRAQLTTAMGAERQISAALVEPLEPPPLPPAADSLLHEAQNQRADLNAAEAQQEAAQRFATAVRSRFTTGRCRETTPRQDST